MVKITTTPATKTLRYSDEDLKKFKSIILIEIQKVNETLDLLRGINFESGEAAHSSEGVHAGTLANSLEEAGTFIARQEKYKELLTISLFKIENKTYGICKKTGELIPKKRLLAALNATYCIT